MQVRTNKNADFVQMTNSQRTARTIEFEAEDPCPWAIVIQYGASDIIPAGQNFWGVQAVIRGEVTGGNQQITFEGPISNMIVPIVGGIFQTWGKRVLVDMNLSDLGLAGSFVANMSVWAFAGVSVKETQSTLQTDAGTTLLPPFCTEFYLNPPYQTFQQLNFNNRLLSTTLLGAPGQFAPLNPLAYKLLSLDAAVSPCEFVFKRKAF